MHCIVTGASSGIGAAIARDFSSHGADVTLVARRTARLEALADELQTKAHVVTADLSELETCTDWLAEAVRVLGPADVLVNNAGVQVVEPFEDGDPDRHDLVLRVNLAAPMRLARAVVGPMLERGQGTIVNVASLAALAPTPFMSSYNASKAGLAGWSEALRGELRKTGVNVVTVYPGPVKTAMADAAVDAYANAGKDVAGGLPTGNTQTLAERVRRAVERGSARLTYPRVYVVAKWFPGLTRFLVDRMTPSLRDTER